MVVGMRQTSSAVSTTNDCSLPGVGAHRLQRHHGEQEDDRQRGQQDRQRDLVGRLLPGRALDQRDHAVDERLARPRRDLHDDPVGQHGGAAGDRAAVAARLADDRRRLAGDRRLVDGRDALDDVAVARDRLARLDDHEVADRSARCRRPAFSTPSTSLRATVSFLVRRSDSAWALPRPSATASARLANSTVNHSQTAMRTANTLGVGDRRDRDEHRAHPHDEHDGVAQLRAGVELAQGVGQRGPQLAGCEGARLHACRCGSQGPLRAWSS